jgi:hypothetical protein
MPRPSIRSRVNRNGIVSGIGNLKKIKSKHFIKIQLTFFLDQMLRLNQYE